MEVPWLPLTPAWALDATPVPGSGPLGKQGKDLYYLGKLGGGKPGGGSDPDLCLGDRNPFFFPFYFFPSPYSPFVVRQHFEKLLTFFFSSPSRLRREVPPARSPGPALPGRLQSPSA